MDFIRRRKNEDEEALLGDKHIRRDLVTGDIAKSDIQKPKIPSRAIKSIVVACILILLGITCFTLFGLSYGPLYIAFHENRIALFIIGFFTINAGGWALSVAYKCYYMIGDYRWPMLFL